jgi:hypothetical protein
MSALPLEYLRKFASEAPGLDEALTECVKEWEPETPPITIAFAQVGHAIAEHLDSYDISTTKRVFRMIEEAMASRDEVLATAMATGLVEAIVTASDKREGLWKKLELLFGSQSLKHANAWRNFGRP